MTNIVAERCLLDTHAVIWWAFDMDRLPQFTRKLIEDPDNTIFFSPVTAMEISTKVRIGKFEEARPLAKNFGQQMLERGLVELPLNAAHAEMAGSFLSGNNDPWDRLLAAQARIEQMGLVTNDGKMDEFGVRIIW